MITADEYYQYTGYLAPADFESCKAMARQQLDACTLYAYVGRDFDSLPGLIQTAWKQAIALQTCAISQNGGVAGMSQQPQQSVSLGKFSYQTGGGNAGMEAASALAFSPAVKAVTPLLISYGRTLRKACQKEGCGCFPSL